MNNANCDPADPDRNNPSRPRMERPLDTIRGFAAAAEGTASRRSSSYGSYSNRPGKAPPVLPVRNLMNSVSQYNSEPAHSRPGSYYNCKSDLRTLHQRLMPDTLPAPGYGPRSYGRQTPGGGYYRQNSYGFQGHSHGSFDEAAEYDHRDQYRPAPPRAGPGMRNMHPSNPYYGHPSESAEHATHQPSYETMTSGSDENGKSTNPSSLNSSYDQLHMAQHPHARKVDYYPHGHQNQYENETSHAPVSPVSPQNQGQGNAYGGVSPQYDYTQQNGGFYPRQYANPALPPKDYQSNGARKPIRLDGPPGAPSSGTANVLRNGDGNKRQSWLSRKFSRKEK